MLKQQCRLPMFIHCSKNRQLIGINRRLIAGRTENTLINHQSDKKIFFEKICQNSVKSDKIQQIKKIIFLFFIKIYQF